ncbi:ATP-binding protein [Zophobihabitans entericus]|uniref:histidine kinase n=1 Tax=Zophobihabitans entericus TaxID=1635327 RepID=A0A6G9I8I3_9GAMM|nr:ATP-binding protein [Zophobihabitans entericus]QIQ20528.1 HAMP domain-containing protein [Zophobihabitans entericus]
MSRRLFWKILLTFWVIFVIAFQTTWTLFYIYVEKNREEFHVSTKIQIISQLIHLSGTEEADRFIASLPEPERYYYDILLIPLEETQKQFWEDNYLFYDYKQAATSPDGVTYLVAFADIGDNKKSQLLFNMPIPLILMGGFSGLIFSVLLTWNLTRPLKVLQRGFSRVAQGDLSVRLFSKLRRRHDELSDVARDFDLMVEHLHILMTERQMLLDDVSHELRTPLARLQLAIGLAQQNKQNIESSLQRIELESQRLDRLIGEILSFSRSQIEDRLDEYFDLKDLLIIVVSDASYEGQTQNIKVKFEASPLIKHSIIKGNAEQIRRAIENIIRNAMKYSNRGNKVSISLKEIGKFLQIDVKDQGPGVEESKLSRIFEPFVRIPTPNIAKGYGLGLAIARKTVQAHNGTIQATNISSGGLQVTIKIPYWSD